MVMVMVIIVIIIMICTVVITIYIITHVVIIDVMRSGSRIGQGTRFQTYVSVSEWLVFHDVQLDIDSCHN